MHEAEAIKRPRRDPRARGFTLIELLMVVAIIAILASLLLPAITRGKMRARQIQCSSNLKQVGVAFHAFAHDHNSDFPWQISTKDGGTMEPFQAAYSGNQTLWTLFPHLDFQALSNDLVDPKVLVCPSDRFRDPAMNFQRVNNTNVSYWVNEAARYDTPQSMLAGDRNIKTLGGTFGPFIRFATNEDIRWTADLHEHRGNILFADTSVAGYKGGGPALAGGGSSSSGGGGGSGVSPPPSGGVPPLGTGGGSTSGGGGGSTYPGGSSGSPPSSPGGGNNSSGGGVPPQPANPGSSARSGGAGMPGGGNSGSGGGGLFDNLDNALSGNQPSRSAPRSSSSRTAPRITTRTEDPSIVLLTNRPTRAIKTNAPIVKKEEAPALQPAPEPAPSVTDTFKTSFALPVLDEAPVNIKAIVLLLLAAFFTFELLRRHRRRKKVRRQFIMSP